METIPTGDSQTRTPSLPFASTVVTLRTHASALSHTGLVRSQNQDHFLIANVTSAIQVVQTSLASRPIYFGPNPTGLFVVADGMGGHAAGDKAAELAVVALERFILGALSRLAPIQGIHPIDLLQKSFHQADEDVMDASDGRSSLTGMGTTMTAALVTGAELFVANAGDSRAYMLRSGRLYQITRDHTVLQALQDAGVVSAAESLEHPMKHVVTNAIGGGERGVSAYIKRIDAQAGDVLLLCSDGLTDMVPDAQLKDLLAAAPTPEVACAQLVQAALDAGGRDNVTVLVVRFASVS